MTQQLISLGTGPNTGTGDNPYNAFTKVNANFTELYGGSGSLPTLQAAVTALVPQYPGASAVLPLSFQSILGQIDPRTYAGYDNTGATDQTAIFNSCIQAAIAANFKFKIPAGMFLISGMLICNALGSNVGRSSVYIAGQGTAYTAYTAVSYAAETILVSGNGNLPIMSINNGYGTVIENIGFYGLNTAPGNQQPGGTPGYPIDNQSLYVSSGVRSDTYSPHAGLVIDAFNVATAPTGGGYPGQSYGQNTGQGSSNILVRNCAFNNFVVGIGCSVGGSGAAGDNLRFESVQMTSNDTNYAFCSPNAHCPVIERGSWAYSRVGANCTQWGGGLFNSTPPILKDLQVNWGYWLAQTSDSAGAMSIINVYQESMRAVYQFGGGSSSYRCPLTVIGSSLKVSTQFGSNTVKLPPVPIETYGPTSHVGSLINIDDGVTPIPAFNIGGNGVPVYFEGCTLPASSTAGVPPYIGVPYNQNYGAVRLRDCYVTDTAGGFTLTDDGCRQPSFQTVSPSYDRIPATYYKGPFSVANTNYQPVPIDTGPVLGFNVSALTLVGSVGAYTSCTFNASNTSLLQVNDILMWQYIAQGISTVREIRAGLQVSSVVGAAVTCNLIWDPIEYDIVANQPSTTTLQLLRPICLPSNAVTGTLDGSTAVITSVSPTTIFKNGDFIYGTGIPSLARVVSGGGTASLTLNLNTTAAGSGVALTGNMGLYTPTLSRAA